jgi:hypothetical protein
MRRGRSDARTRSATGCGFDAPGGPQKLAGPRKRSRTELARTSLQFGLAISRFLRPRYGGPKHER